MQPLDNRMTSPLFSLDSAGGVEEMLADKEREQLRKEKHSALAKLFRDALTSFSVLFLDCFEDKILGSLDLSSLYRLREINLLFKTIVDILPLYVERKVIYETIRSTSFGFDARDWENYCHLELRDDHPLPLHILSILKRTDPYDVNCTYSLFQSHLFHLHPEWVRSTESKKLSFELYHLMTLKQSMSQTEGMQLAVSKHLQEISCGILIGQTHWVARRKQPISGSQLEEEEEMGTMGELATSEYMHWIKTGQSFLNQSPLTYARSGDALINTWDPQVQGYASVGGFDGRFLYIEINLFNHKGYGCVPVWRF